MSKSPVEKITRDAVFIAGGQPMITLGFRKSGIVRAEIANTVLYIHFICRPERIIGIFFSCLPALNGRHDVYAAAIPASSTEPAAGRAINGADMAKRWTDSGFEPATK